METKTNPGYELILKERIRQVEEEKYSKENDLLYTDNVLVDAAICYEQEESERVYGNVSFFGSEEKLVPVQWPFQDIFWKPTPNDRVRELVKAGALYMAAGDARKSNVFETRIHQIAEKINVLIEEQNNDDLTGDILLNQEEI